MSEDTLPSNFDWVTARAKCSAVEMVESLRELTKANVEKINTFRGGTSPNGPRFKFKDSESNLRQGFAVFDTFGYQRRAVNFWLQRDTIRVESTDNKPTLVITLTLNDAGQCRFKVADEELDQWQLLRRALEWLFFDELI